MIALDAALEKLAGLDRRQAQLVELRFFGGLTVDEAAAVMDVAAITANATGHWLEPGCTVSWGAR